MILSPGTIPANDWFIFGKPLTGTGTVLIPDRIHFLAFRVPICFNVKELGVFVAVVATFAQKMVMGIYDFDLKTGNPVNLLYQPSGELSLDGVTGYKNFNTNFQFDPGIYCIAYNCSAGAVVAQCRRVLSEKDPILPQSTGDQIVSTKFKYMSNAYSSVLPSIISGTIIENNGVDIANFIIKAGVI